MQTFKRKRGLSFFTGGIAFYFPNIIKGILESGISFIEYYAIFINDNTDETVAKTPQLRLGFWGAIVSLVLCYTKTLTLSISPWLCAIAVLVLLDIISSAQLHLRIRMR